MSTQPQKRPQGGNDDGTASPDETPVGANAQAQKRVGELDSLLDEIDSVLESNAEEFVKGFVQKGGE